MTTTPTLREAAERLMHRSIADRKELARNGGGCYDEDEDPLIVSLRAALAEQAGPMCQCGHRPASQCAEPWEPGCDLGNNEAHVKVSTQSVEQPEPVVWECKAGGLKKLTQSQYDKQRDVVKQYYSRIETPAVSATTDEDRNRFEAAWNQHRCYLGSDVGVSAKDIAWAVWQAGVATSPTLGCEQASPAYLAEPGAAQATRADLVANWPQHNRVNMTVKLYCTPPTTKDKHDT